jgi:predicted acyltransferase
MGVATAQHRSLPLDVLRGMTLALMIVVNMSIEGVSYAPLLHAPWNGLTPTDMVFPTFLFVVGAALSYAIGKYETLGEAAVLGKIARRTVLIFLCGYLVHWFPFGATDAAGHFAWTPLGQTRILGVLQRIALCYGMAALIVHYGGRRAALYAGVAALLIYWWLLWTFGDYTRTGNAVLKLDLWLLGPQHLHRENGVIFDPEGFLSTLPALFNVLAGYLTGLFLRERRAGVPATTRLLAAGALAIALALAWNTALPVNKCLWTSSYALITTGIDLVVLGLLYWAIEQRCWRAWTPFFEIFGRNTLFIYILSELGESILEMVHVGKLDLSSWLYQSALRPWAGAQNGALLLALGYMLFCWCVAWALDRRRIYFRL